MDREAALLYAAEVRLRPILMTTLAMVFGMVPLAFALSEGSEQRAPMGQAVIGGVITSSLLTLVVVPVVYCYLDDFSRWVKRRVFRRPVARPAVDPARHEPAMNIEQARFNMIEQQIRPWEVLDRQRPVAARRGQARGVRAAGLPRAGLRRHRGAAARTASAMLAPKVEARLLQELAVQRHERVLEVGAGSGYMAALLAHKAQHVTTLEIDPELAALRRRQPAARLGHERHGAEADASTAPPVDGPFDVIVLSGSVAEVPQALLGQLKPGGRLVAIVGQLPVMRAELVTRARPGGRIGRTRRARRDGRLSSRRPVRYRRAAAASASASRSRFIF